MPAELPAALPGSLSVVLPRSLSVTMPASRTLPTSTPWNLTSDSAVIPATDSGG